MLDQAVQPRSASEPRFESIQPGVFGISGGQPGAWADADGDGDLDLFTGMKAGIPNRLLVQERGVFKDVASNVGIADEADTRGMAWGDFDADGNIDLYVGFTKRSGVASKLYRNDGGGKHFTDVAATMGVDASGFETRQVAWVDFDNDGRVDLFVAFRDGPNKLFRNEGARFREVGQAMGVDDPRKTVGAVWFDYNQDGRLDVFCANQDGDKNGLWRNDGNSFTDVAAELGMEGIAPGRAAATDRAWWISTTTGSWISSSPATAATSSTATDGKGGFSDVSERLGVAGGDRATPSSWGDFDNDGRPDLYVSSYIDKPPNEKDFLFRNDGGLFVDVTTELFRKHGATHMVEWADYDADGAIDLAFGNNNPEGRNGLFRNLLPPAQAARSLQVRVLDANGRSTRAGAEVRLYAAGTRKAVGSRIVSTGGGYTSQGQTPVHVGLGETKRVDVEVTGFTTAGRKVTRVASVDPAKVPGRILVVKLPR